LPIEKSGCPICNGYCSPIKHGGYWRNSISADGVKEKIRIQRYLCKSTERTFSFLPEHLIPYRVPSLPLLAELWRTMLFSGKSHQQTLADIGKRFTETVVANMEYSCLQDFSRILQAAMERVTILHAKPFSSILNFFEYCEHYRHNGRTGFLAIAQSFYAQHHQFLFGTASQHR
jgi:transposase-like protein